ncbi:MAG: DUF3667 domain-containing protein [Chitinophagaceae bacterium]|nr:MAG: DUF3667 domain-containing protein [Chitinophagaceae bacterium]
MHKYSDSALLLLKPGHLSAAYIRGERMKYLDPVRMYLFISALFLLYVVSFFSHPEYINLGAHPEYVSAVDSMRISHYRDNLEPVNIDSNGHNYFILNVPESMRHGQRFLDSVRVAQHKPIKSATLRYLTSKLVNTYQAYDTNPYNFLPKAIEAFLHSFSKIFFISLPVFVLLLSLLYISRREQFNGVAHAIFSLHFYCVCFIIIILIDILSKLFAYTQASETFDSIALFVWWIGVLLYLFLAMKRFYGQGALKTFVKAFGLFMIAGLFIGLVTGIFFLNSFLTVS